MLRRVRCFLSSRLTMNTRSHLATVLALALCSTTLFAGDTAAPSTATRERIGIYDSRAVAYAHFWHPAECMRRDARIAAARAAKAAGDRQRFKELDAALKETQAHTHLQIFSTAPAAEAMADLAPRVPALQTELGVTRLVSKWDEKTLRQFRTAEQVDVTNRLVREFITPTEKQQKTIDSMKTNKPLALWKAKGLLFFGGM